MTTMTADPPRRTSLGVGFDAGRNRTAENQAWKQQIGTRPVPARLALLPEAKPNWHRVGFSAVLQLSVLAFFILVPLLYPEGMKTAVRFYNSTPLTTPPTEIPVAPPPPPPPKAVAPKIEAKAAVPFVLVKLTVQLPVTLFWLELEPPFPQAQRSNTGASRSAVTNRFIITLSEVANTKDARPRVWDAL